MIRVLEIDRGKLWRGAYCRDGKYCAIGFYALKTGLDNGTAADQIMERGKPSNADLSLDIVRANDKLKGAMRERKLKSLFKKAGVELRFKGKTPK